MSRSSDKVKRWRDETKKRIVMSMGGKCQICGYSKCQAALDLHHIVPSEKEFGFGKITSNPKAWAKIVPELRKCILVCSNCHREIHDGITELPNNFETFNEEYLEYRVQKDEYDPEPCPVCGGKKRYGNITCSSKCAAKRTRKVDWDSVDLESLLKEHTYIKIGDMLGVSDVAVRKRAKKLELI